MKFDNKTNTIHFTDSELEGLYDDLHRMIERDELRNYDAMFLLWECLPEFLDE